MEGFIMGFHIYKSAWTPCVGDQLDRDAVQDYKYDVAVFLEGRKYIVGIFPWKVWKICKDNFYFLTADKQKFMQGNRTW